MENRYCKQCKLVHTLNELCPREIEQLRRNPQLITEAATFTSIAGQYGLCATQALDSVGSAVNKLASTNLSFEGAQQAARDIQVFKQLSVDAYCNCGVFDGPANAQAYQAFLDAKGEKSAQMLLNKLTGTAQEVDWQIAEGGKLKSIFQKSYLVGEHTPNAPGIDGETVWRFTGKTVSRTSVKAATTQGGVNTNVSGVIKSLKNGTLNPRDALFGIEGTQEVFNKTIEKELQLAIQEGNTELVNRLQEAKQHLTITESGTQVSTQTSTDRLLEKVVNGEAVTTIGRDQIAQQALQGAVIGAAVALTVSAISTYLKFKNGEITREEAIRDIAQDTLNGAVVGAAMGTISLFLPAGAIGFVGGMAIGIYVGTLTKNILAEVFGKGAFEAILHSSGFVFGTTSNLKSVLRAMELNHKKIQQNTRNAITTSQNIDDNLSKLDSLLKE
jgi:hypothetical protein